MKTVCAVLVLLIGGCTSSVDPGPVGSYPLLKNSVWNYTSEAAFTNFRPTRTGISFPETVIAWRTQVRSEGVDTLLDSVAAWKFTVTDSGAVSSSGVQYYRIKGDTMFLLAYYNANLALPKRSPGYRWSAGGREFASLEALIGGFADGLAALDTVYVETYPLPVFVYPLATGNQWTYSKPPFRIDKKVVGAEEVKTDAGTFACYKIQWLWDFDNNGVWDTLYTGFDDVNDKGLIRRSILLKDVGITYGDTSGVIGYVDLENRYTVNELSGAVFPAAAGRPSPPNQ